jgi:polyisoprenoid-binding protein YceI
MIMRQESANWVFEPAHCKIGFSVRHFGIAETEGFFRKFTGAVRNEKTDFSDAVVDITIDAASIDTQDDGRDQHLRSAEFLNTDQFPAIRFQTSKTEPAGGGKYKMHGELTITGTTKPIVLDIEFGGIIEKDPFGYTKAGFLVTGAINRKEWGISWNRILDMGGVAVGETVYVKCHIELLKTQKIQ